MAKLVANGAQLKCSQGSSPAKLTVLPALATDAADAPLAVVTDNVPLVQVGSFGMCRSPANPAVAMATSAAFGVLTPMPCLPVLPSPWTPGASGVQIAGKPALTKDSTCTCAYMGTIEVTQAASEVEGE